MQMKTHLLVIDTSAGNCAVALFHIAEQKVVARSSEMLERGQADVLMPRVETLLEKAGIFYPNLARVGVVNGPGSFYNLNPCFAL